MKKNILTILFATLVILATLMVILIYANFKNPNTPNSNHNVNQSEVSDNTNSGNNTGSNTAGNEQSSDSSNTNSDLPTSNNPENIDNDEYDNNLSNGEQNSNSSTNSTNDNYNNSTSNNNSSSNPTGSNTPNSKPDTSTSTNSNSNTNSNTNTNTNINTDKPNNENSTTTEDKTLSEVKTENDQIKSILKSDTYNKIVRFTEYDQKYPNYDDDKKLKKAIEDTADAKNALFIDRNIRIKDTVTIFEKNNILIVSNTTKYKIKMDQSTTHGNSILNFKNANNVTVRNVSFENTGYGQSGDPDPVQYPRTSIRWFGSGISASNSKNIVIYGCKFRKCSGYDGGKGVAAIYMSRVQNVVVEKNDIRYCDQAVCFDNWYHDAANKTELVNDNITIKNNFVRYCHQAFASFESGEATISHYTITNNDVQYVEHFITDRGHSYLSIMNNTFNGIAPNKNPYQEDPSLGTGYNWKKGKTEALWGDARTQTIYLNDSGSWGSTSAPANVIIKNNTFSNIRNVIQGSHLGNMTIENNTVTNFTEGIIKGNTNKSITFNILNNTFKSEQKDSNLTLLKITLAKNGDGSKNSILNLKNNTINGQDKKLFETDKVDINEYNNNVTVKSLGETLRTEFNPVWIEYSYNKTTKVVTTTAKIIRGSADPITLKFNNTKPSWTLSADSLFYKKTFTTDQNYKTTFTLSNGKEYEKVIQFKLSDF